MWKLYLRFSTLIKEKNRADQAPHLSLLIYVLRSFFQQKLSRHINDGELLHFFLSLFSPSFKLDENSFTKDLLQEYLDKGGLFSKGSITKCSFQRKKLLNLTLSETNKTFQPKKVDFFGEHFPSLPIGFSKNPKIYRSFSLYNSLEKNIPCFNDFLWGDFKEMGREIPIWFAHVEDQKVQVNVFYRHRVGIKEESLISQFIPKLNKQLSNLMGNFKNDWTKISKQQDIFLTDNPKNLYSKLEHLENPNKSVTLNNVNYLGTCRNIDLGILENFIQIKGN